MKVSAIPSAVHIQTRIAGTMDEVLQDMEPGFSQTEAAIRSGSRLIVTVEGSNRFGRQTDADFCEKIARINRVLFPRYEALSAQGACIVAGLYTTDGQILHNSAVVFDRGRCLGVYHKIHLPADEVRFTVPGDRYCVFETSVGKVAPVVCWDMQFPEAVRILALRGADVIACPTWGWEDIFRCRAYENSVPMVVAMALAAENGRVADVCDPSCIVDFNGRIVAQASRTGTEAVTAELPIGADPAPQYGSKRFTGFDSMRRTRLVQRRPDTYGELTDPRPALYRKYEKEADSDDGSGQCAPSVARARRIYDRTADRH